MDDLAGAVAAHFAAIGKDDVRAGEIYAENAVLEYVQSGERICGKSNTIAARRAYPGRPAPFDLDRSLGTNDFQVAELTLRVAGDDPHPVVAILEFQDGKVVRERTLHCGALGIAPVPRAVGGAEQFLTTRTLITVCRTDPFS